MPNVFLDTNILLYAASKNLSETRKRERAIQIIAEVDFAVSSQVLGEFYVNVRRGRQTMSHVEAKAMLEALRDQGCVAVDHDVVLRGAEMSDRYRISYYDAAILAAAEKIGCETVFTEDLNDGQQYGAVRVENPFKDL